jgi:hypothetical protein
MPRKGNGVSPALKHGAYAKATLLPGEDPDEFKKLHEGLIAEFRPNGRMEEETIASIARLMWRRQNLPHFEIAQLSQYMADVIRKVVSLEPITDKEDKEFLGKVGGLIEPHLYPQMRKWVRPGRELEDGEVHELLKVAALNRLMKELDVEERLDAMIERLIKRLLFVRGLKSVTSSEVIASSYAPRKSLPRIQPS